MSENNFEPKQLHILTEAAQIKAYVHPVRMMLLQMLAREKRTISGIAREMNVHPANLTHHFKLLEKAGLIVLVEKRDTGKNLEKYYRSIAINFVTDASSAQNDDKKSLALSILKDNLSLAVNNVRDDDGKEVLALLGMAKLNAKDLNRFIKKLNGLMAEFSKCDSKGGTPYCMNLSLYPNVADPSDESNIEIKL